MFLMADQDWRMLSAQATDSVLYTDVTILEKASQGVTPADMSTGAEEAMALSGNKQ